MASVKILFGGQEMQAYRLDQPQVRVGRDESCDIHIDNLGISRSHCQFEKAPGGYVVRDLNSANGTFVNGKRIQEHTLTNNDQVLIGKFTLIFMEDGREPEIAASTGGTQKAEEVDGAGGFDQMHTYVMDGAAIRERLMSGEGAPGAGPKTRRARPAAQDQGGGSKIVLMLALITLVVLLGIAGFLVYQFMQQEAGDTDDLFQDTPAATSTDTGAETGQNQEAATEETTAP